MNEITRRLYLRFVADRIQSALEGVAEARSGNTDFYLDCADRDLQEALEKLRLVQEAEEDKD